MKKTIKTLAGIGVLAVLLIVQSCIPEHIAKKVRIRKMYWENIWYSAHYNSVGRLTELLSDSSKLLFYYDESDKLYKAEIYIPNEATAKYIYTFTHGPHGITEIDLKQYGNAYQKDIITYNAGGDIVGIHQFTPLEWPYEVDFKTLYDGDNLTDMYEGDVPDEEGKWIYSAGTFDNKVNPFRMLANAVGNPDFFPVGRLWFEPLAGEHIYEGEPPFVLGTPYEFEVNYISRFSKNNPLTASYDIPGTDFLTSQIFEYTYSGSLVTSIKWRHLIVSEEFSEDYKFEYELAPVLP